MQLTNRGFASHYKKGFHTIHTIGVSHYNDIKTIWWKILWYANDVKKEYFEAAFTL